jgi:hypothetical protein
MTTRIIAMLVGALLIIGILIFGVRQCQLRHSEAAQGRVNASQAEAASNSAADAIGTVEAAGARETASEALTRENQRNIMAADGADTPVNPAVWDQGIIALCKRESYANDIRCRRP